MPSVVDRRPQAIADVVTTLNRTAHTYRYGCLAAVHVGVPVRVGLARNGTWILVNPRVVDVGPRLSKGHERSAFYPHEPPCRMRRFWPVTVVHDRWDNDDDDDDLTSMTTVVRDRATVHCVMHLLDQFEGRTPCAPRR